MVRWSLSEMASAVKQGKVSAPELLRAHVERIHAENGKLNAFIEVYDEGLPGAPNGPLAGVPVTVKDSFDIGGRVTYCGSALRKGAIAEKDSVLVARLRAAGAVIVGKTATPEFLYNYETDNKIIGRTNHPWNPEYTPGGSSGGEAAAIAAFCSAGGIGSDGGGSIREPAHFCGICGLKTTPGRMPMVGHWPESANPTGFMGVAGPMARTVEDVNLLFNVLAGPDPRDPYAAPVGVCSMPSEGVRVAVMADGGAPVQDACAAALWRAVTLLKTMGHDLEQFAPSRIEGAHDLWRALFVDYLSPAIQAMVQGREAECSWTGLELVGMVKEVVDVWRLGEILLQRDRLRAALLHWMGERTLIVAPAFGVTAFPHRQRKFAVRGGEIELLDAVRVVSPWNLLGMPAMVIPMGVDANGMPAGVQIIGAPWCEELVLDLAQRLETARGSEWQNEKFSPTSTSNTTSKTG